jgi:hypothetical protein
VRGTNCSERPLGTARRYDNSGLRFGGDALAPVAHNGLPGDAVRTGEPHPEVLYLTFLVKLLLPRGKLVGRTQPAFAWRSGSIRGLPGRCAPWYASSCHDVHRQFDESQHGYAPCWLVCLNPKVPQQSEPTFEGSPSAGGTVSSRSRPSYSADHQTAHRSFRCKGAHLAVEGR